MRTIRLLLLAVLSLALLGAAPPSFTPYLVKDINPYPTPDSSNPDGFVTLGGLALFQIDSESPNADRDGLWRTDGTASGTYRLMAAENVQSLTVAGERCFFDFQVDDRRYLGVTDGTVPGTVTLAEVEPRGSSREVWIPRQRLFYFLSSSSQLWRSDGTSGGTYAIADLPLKPDFYDENLTSFHGRLYLTTGFALWQSDGTAAGTVKVLDVQAASLQVVGSLLVLIGTDSQGAELWASDGTAAGTRRIADLTPGAGSTTFNGFKVVGKRLFFSATTPARGDQLYVTDGTAGGTRRLTAFGSNAGWPGPMEALGDHLFFAASDPEHGRELWSSDGTPKGTHMVVDATPGESPSNPGFFFSHRGRLYYQATGGLWVTDGTAAGTRKISNLLAADQGWVWFADPSADRMFVITSTVGNFDELWSTDGTAGGTVDLGLCAGGLFSSSSGTVAGGALLFAGWDEDHGVEPWRSDGAPAGTHLVTDIASADFGGSNPHSFMTLGDSVLFFASEFPGRYKLWRSDGTEAGTTALDTPLQGLSAWTSSATRAFFVSVRSAMWTSDGTQAGTYRLTPAGVRCQGALSAPVIRLGSRVFFSAWFPPSGTEPWVTDGTPQGTKLLADLNPGRGGSNPDDFTVFAGKAWFTAMSHLWKSDGTTKGTVAVGPELQDLHPRTTFGGRLWFTGTGSAGSTELWATDGTAARTERIATLETIESLTVHAGRLWFLGNGSELWSTDGTAVGTRSLVDLPGSSFGSLLSDGARLYITDSSSALWVSDGTAAGTQKLSDQGIQDGSWIAFAGRLYYASSEGSFYTSDGTAAGTRPVRTDGEPRGATSLLRFGDQLVAINGRRELWQSDGTTEGTKQVSPQTELSVRIPVKAGSRLFFNGWEAATGSELWTMHE